MHYAAETPFERRADWNHESPLTKRRSDVLRHETLVFDAAQYAVQRTVHTTLAGAEVMAYASQLGARLVAYMPILVDSLVDRGRHRDKGKHTERELVESRVEQILAHGILESQRSHGRRVRILL